MTTILILIIVALLAYMFLPVKLGTKGAPIPFLETRTASPTYPAWYKDQPPIYEAKKCFVIYPKDFAWATFLSANLNKLYPIEGGKYFRKEYPRYFKIKGHDNLVVKFSDTWMWHIYNGKDAEEISNRFDEGGTSNLADYLTPAQLKMGVKIQNWYINFLDDKGFYVENCGYSREKIRPKSELQQAS